MKKNILIIAGAAIVLLALLITGSYLFYWKPKPAAVAPDNLVNAPKTEELAETGAVGDKAIENATKGVLPDIQTNPLDDKPDLNPVDKTNPYKNIKTNPFK